MKISQIVISIIVILVGGAIAMYSSDQQKVMDVVTAAHGGGSQVADTDATGLRKLNQDLETEAAAAAGARSEAIKSSEAARVEMRDHRDKRNDAEAKLEGDKATLADTQKKVKAAQDNLEQIRASYNSAIEQLKTASHLDIPEAVTFGEAIDAIKNVVDRETARAKELSTELEEVSIAREAATEKLGKEQAELSRLDGINDRFFKNYVHNGDEFTVLAADSRWRFVVFKVGKDSGLVVGDSTPLLVKRGDVVITPVRIISIKDGICIAEFDPTKLPDGVRPQIGDRAFRQKPLGN